ncbi:hypothetical protein HD554DRAFT_2223169 [Boletus coccyginus]|nr:hypothetical protein HD554DRAFT_2223169 [Boletus coccyginus]
MASWIDVFSLLMVSPPTHNDRTGRCESPQTTLFFVGIVLGVLYAGHAISSRFQSTKASLEERGITLSRGGVSLKTEKRFDRDAYLDATQRGLVKALGAATVGSESHKQTLLPHTEDEHEKPGMSLRRLYGGGEGH